MAGCDNVLFGAAVASGTAAGTVVPLTLLDGIENVRQGLGTPKLKNIRFIYDGLYSSGSYGVPVDVKNSAWIDAAGGIAQDWDEATTLNRDSYSFMRGRDKELTPNTSWTIAATIPANTTAAGNIYVLFEIEYSAVDGVSTEKRAGSPVVKTCSVASVSGSANVPFSIGSFDNLLTDTTYLLSEAYCFAPNVASIATFLKIEGFTNQRGLMRIIPVKNTGLADQIEGSVFMTKQTYNLALIRSGNTSSAAISVRLEMIASKN